MESKEGTAEQPSAADEQYWRDRMKQMRLQDEDLKNKASEAEIECQRTGGRSSYEKAGSTYFPNTIASMQMILQENLKRSKKKW